MGDLLLGIDIGTYSSKGVLCRLDGTILAHAKTEHIISIPKAGYAEQDAEKVWWSDFCQVVRRLTQKIPHGEKIVGVGVSAIGACLLPVDSSGNPLRPGILYGIDTRSGDQIEALENRFGHGSLVEFCGSRLTSQSIGPKILWLKENEPEIYRNAAKFLTASSYIINKLTGEFVIDAHTASEFHPLFNIKTCSWDDKFSDPITPLDKLPRIGWADDAAGSVTHWASEECGIPAGTPVNYGTIDALSEAVSVGVVGVGDLMIMYGSTTCLVFYIENPVPTEELWLEAGFSKGQYEYTAGMSTSGSATTWFRERFGKDLLEMELSKGVNAYAALANEAVVSPCGSNGLLVLPYLSGERTPIFDQKARGVLAGFSLHHTRGDLYRALLEGIAFATRMNLEAMQKTGVRMTHGIAVGGGTSNQLWLQIVSDVTGVPQLLPEETIGASYGDAFLAGLAVGAIKDKCVIKEQWVKIKSKIEPTGTTQPTYEKLYQLFLELYLVSKSVIHQLSDMQR